MNKLGCTGLRSTSSKKKVEKNKEDHQDPVELKKQLDELAAERQAKLAKGASISKIDTQLKILQELLDAKDSKVPQDKKKAARKPGKKRACIDEESDAEDSKELKQDAEKPAKKKRVSAKDKRIAKNEDESTPELKTFNKNNIKNNIKSEENNVSNGNSEERKRKLAKKELPTKKIKEEDNENGFQDDVEEKEEPVKAKRGRPRKVKKEN